MSQWFETFIDAIDPMNDTLTPWEKVKLALIAILITILSPIIIVGWFSHRVLKRMLLLVFCLMMFTGISFAATTAQTDLCLIRLTPYVDLVNDAGLYPSAYLAAGLLETGHCSSEAVRYNNYWGIKCMRGLCFSKQTWEVYSGKTWRGPKLFQVFDSAKEGTEAYCRKILWQKEYQDVDYSSRDAFIESMGKVWALDPKYSAKLKDIIQRYDLTKYDRRD